MGVRFVCELCGADISGKTNHVDVCAARRQGFKRPSPPLTHQPRVLDSFEKVRLAAEEACKEIDRLRQLFASLTPGGSEFVDEPDRCAEYVRDKITSLQDAAKNVVKSRNAELDRLREVNRELREGLTILHRVFLQRQLSANDCDAAHEAFSLFAKYQEER